MWDKAEYRTPDYKWLIQIAIDPLSLNWESEFCIQLHEIKTVIDKLPFDIINKPSTQITTFVRGYLHAQLPGGYSPFKIKKIG